jgi:hypothetical protein
VRQAQRDRAELRGRCVRRCRARQDGADAHRQKPRKPRESHVRSLYWPPATMANVCA